MQPVTYDCVGFHSSFNREHNVLSILLRDHFPLRYSPGSAEFLFVGDFDSPHHEPRYDDCTKIYYTEEKFGPDFDDVDYALTCGFVDDPRHLRMPLYVRYLLHLAHWTKKTIVRPDDFSPEAVLAKKTKFCNFVYSNSAAKERMRFFEALSKYKLVDAGGRVYNNIGGPVVDKLAFISDYKFTIAFENTSLPGYVTEKIVESMVEGSLPIYWGNPRIGEDFDESSFINVTGLSPERGVELVMAADRDDRIYLDYLRRPCFAGNRPNRYCEGDYLVPFFTKVFADRTRGRVRKEREKIPRPISGNLLSWADRLALTNKKKGA